MVEKNKLRMENG